MDDERTTGHKDTGHRTQTKILKKKPLPPSSLPLKQKKSEEEESDRLLSKMWI